jgi:galactokinase
VLVRAPGRVNLIGDHTDYQEGWCLPVAIDREVRIAFTVRSDARVVMRSQQFDGDVSIPGSPVPPWGRTVVAALDVLAARGVAARGIDATAASTVPVGSGLSSSAAFGVACLLALSDELSGPDLALAAQDVEHRASGVPCGVMDQMASVCGVAGHALLLDCRSLDVTAVALPSAVALVVVHSGLPRRLETSAYAQRRAACEAAAARLGVRTLRDATLDDVTDDPVARHVVTENARVLECADALRAGDAPAAGRLMFASHSSLRDDFAVSTPELDTLVDICAAEGAHGARLTGAGFGGCVVALVGADRATAFADIVADKYRAATALEPMAFRVEAVDGAGRLED